MIKNCKYQIYVPVVSLSCWCLFHSKTFIRKCRLQIPTISSWPQSVKTVDVTWYILQNTSHTSNQTSPFPYTSILKFTIFKLVLISVGICNRPHSRGAVSGILSRQVVSLEDAINLSQGRISWNQARHTGAKGTNFIENCYTIAAGQWSLNILLYRHRIHVATFAGISLLNSWKTWNNISMA